MYAEHTKLISRTAAVFLLAFANWPLSLAVSQTMTNICRLIGMVAVF